MKSNNWFDILKHTTIDLLKELIRKNPVDVSSLRRRKVKILSGVVAVVSSVSFGTNAFFFLSRHYRKRGNSNSCSIIKCSSSRLYTKVIWGRRVYGRYFCTDNTTDNQEQAYTGCALNQQNDQGIKGDKIHTNLSIVDKGLSKEVTIFNSNQTSIIDKLTSFKRDKCGKFINLTKEFLSDPMFLRFAYFLIKNNRGVSDDLDGINKEWFEKTADKIRHNNYIFKNARQVEIPKPGGLGKKRILTMTNGRDKIIQKAMAVLLEMIYEKDELFQTESHGFRPNRSCHTALKAIKYTWTGIPYYIEADISKAFDDINRNVLINILKKNIMDKRFIDLISKMYKVDILCPQGFWIKKAQGIMQGNILSPILCNIYLNELDLFVKNEIIYKYQRGTRPQINPEYAKNIGLKKEENLLPLHIRTKIKKQRRRHVEKLGISRTIENCNYVRIKYIRYADDFIIGIRGSKEIAEKIRDLVKVFLKSNLHLEMNMEKTKITDTYSNKASFLGMLIYNKHPKDLPYRNSRSVENAKRVANKNKIKKLNAFNKIIKNTRMKVLKAMEHKSKDIQNLASNLLPKDKKLNYREKVRLLTNLVQEVESQITPQEYIESPKVERLIPKEKPIGKLDIMSRVYNILKANNAVATNLGAGKKAWPLELKLLLEKSPLTYCPMDIKLSKETLDKLIKEGGSNTNRLSSTFNWNLVIKELLSQQDKLGEQNKVTMVVSKQSESRIEALGGGVLHNIRPVIIINREKIYNKLMEAHIINGKRNPCAKTNITTVSDYNIISYFNSIAHGLLSYYRCADDFFKVKSIVNWFIRYSAISTIKFKHKLASRKAVLSKFGKNLCMTNHKGQKVELIDTDYVRQIKKEFLLHPLMDWDTKIMKVWTSFSRNETELVKCNVEGCNTPYYKVEMHHTQFLHREVDSNGYKIIKGKGKKIRGWKALISGGLRKQVPLCLNHHSKIHTANKNK